MIVNGIFRSRTVGAGVLVAFVLLVLPIAEFAQVNMPAAGGSLMGFVFDKDMKTPVPNAVVKLRSVAKAKELESTPADANGMYKITGIPAGRYILGVSSAKGDFNFDYALAIKGKETAKLSVALVEGDGPAAGMEAKKKSFFASPMGIVSIVLVAGAVLYGVLKDDDEEASPVLR